MLLTDYFRSEPDATWDLALQCGVTHGVIRSPDGNGFDAADPSHWRTVVERFRARGITPVVLEPMPNELHEEIKRGGARRDECIEKVIKMLPILAANGINTICFNFMAYIGWLRTSDGIPARGGARVTGFRLADFRPTDDAITERELWSNYEYFIRAVVPHAEKYGVRLALHPDDPPMSLGNVARIMISAGNIERAVRGIVKSDYLGVTMCQATFRMMGEELSDVIPRLADKIFFIHFRNVVGTKTDFRETFHDDGSLDMAELIRLYTRLGLDVPIRVDHVPALAGEAQPFPGYSALGRLFAIGYLKGLLEASGQA